MEKQKLVAQLVKNILRAKKKTPIEFIKPLTKGMRRAVRKGLRSRGRMDLVELTLVNYKHNHQVVLEFQARLAQLAERVYADAAYDRAYGTFDGRLLNGKRVQA